jgi:hypothetical protein
MCDKMGRCLFILDMKGRFVSWNMDTFIVFLNSEHIDFSGLTVYICFVLQESDVDDDEVECIVANLIYEVSLYIKDRLQHFSYLW